MGRVGFTEQRLKRGGDRGGVSCVDNEKEHSRQTEELQPMAYCLTEEKRGA